MNYDKGFLGNTIVSAEKYHIHLLFLRQKKSGSFKNLRFSKYRWHNGEGSRW